MSDEEKESRINVEDLPQSEQTLTAEDAKKVQGGTGGTKSSLQEDFVIKGHCGQDR